MKKTILILSVAFLGGITLNSCGSNSTNEEHSKENSEDTLKVESSDEVTIGKQVWMTKNLNVDKFSNGDEIPEAKTDEEWKEAGANGKPVWCYYNNNPDNGDRYGKLYNWYAVNDERGLAPKGWKIPSIDDWNRLTDFLGGDNVADKKMKYNDLWADVEGVSGNGSNESGFSGLPGGYRYEGGSFHYIGEGGLWWSSTNDGSKWTWFNSLGDYDGITGELSVFMKENGFSVRCVKK